MGKLKIPRTSDGKAHVGKVVPRKTVASLYLYDGDDAGIRNVAPLFAQRCRKINKKGVRSVKTWTELGVVLKQYESIGDLYLDFHGSPGTIKIGNVIKAFKKALTDDLKGPMPSVSGKIDFESCNVGAGPDELVDFARHLSAPKVLAWNYFHVFNTIQVNVPSGTTADDVRRILRPYDGYLTEGNETPEEIAAKPGRHTVFLEWFRDDDNPEQLNPKDTHTFKKRTSANERAIGSSGAKALRKEYDGVPVKPLDHVIMTIE